MSKKKVTAPTTYNPGSGHPKEYLAYLNWQEMQALQRLNGNGPRRGPKGIPSFADDSASSLGNERPPESPYSGYQGGGDGGFSGNSYNDVGSESGGGGDYGGGDYGGVGGESGAGYSDAGGVSGDAYGGVSSSDPSDSYDAREGSDQSAINSADASGGIAALEGSPALANDISKPSYTYGSGYERPSDSMLSGTISRIASQVYTGAIPGPTTPGQVAAENLKYFTNSYMDGRLALGETFTPTKVRGVLNERSLGQYNQALASLGLQSVSSPPLSAYGPEPKPITDRVPVETYKDIGALGVPGGVLQRGVPTRVYGGIDSIPTDGTPAGSSLVQKENDVAGPLGSPVGPRMPTSVSGGMGFPAYTPSGVKTLRLGFDFNTESPASIDNFYGSPRTDPGKTRGISTSPEPASQETILEVEDVPPEVPTEVYGPINVDPEIQDIMERYDKINNRVVSGGETLLRGTLAAATAGLSEPVFKIINKGAEYLTGMDVSENITNPSSAARRALMQARTDEERQQIIAENPQLVPFAREAGVDLTDENLRDWQDQRIERGVVPPGAPIPGLGGSSYQGGIPSKELGGKNPWWDYQFTRNTSYSPQPSRSTKGGKASEGEGLSKKELYRRWDRGIGIPSPGDPSYNEYKVYLIDRGQGRYS